MHTLLGLGWDEWGSIVAIVTSICVLANWILNKTVRIPLNNLGKRLSRFTDESLKVRQQNADTMNAIENRVIKVEGRLDGHDIEFKHLYEKEAKGNEKISFKNADGSLNGKLIAGIISLLIVLIQQVLAMFGIKFTGDWSAIVAVINTVLTILGMLGVITDVQTVPAPTVDSKEESQVEAAANKVADEVPAPTSAVATVDSSASSDTETASESASQAAK